MGNSGLAAGRRAGIYRLLLWSLYIRRHRDTNCAREASLRKVEGRAFRTHAFLLQGCGAISDGCPAAAMLGQFKCAGCDLVHFHPDLSLHKKAGSRAGKRWMGPEIGRAGLAQCAAQHSIHPLLGQQIGNLQGEHIVDFIVGPGFGLGCRPQHHSSHLLGC